MAVNGARSLFRARERSVPRGIVRGLDEQRRNPVFPTRRDSGLIRTTLITYGVAGLSWLLSRSPLHAAAEGLGGFASARLLFFVGVAVQLVLLIARQLIKRHSADNDVARQTLDIVDLIGDAVTVFAFALGTLGAVLHSSASI